MWERLIDDVERLGLSFDEFLALYKVYSYELNSRKIYYESDLLNTYLDLENKGLIKAFNNQDNILSFHLREKGKLLIENFIKQETETLQEVPEIKSYNIQDKFDEFWGLFPNSDEHGIYRKTRILKGNKDICKKKYNLFLSQGIKHEDIIKALRYELKLRKDSNNKNNNLTYMKNSLTWLNQKEFEIILETMSEDNNSTSNDDWTSNSI
jgi:hypothetical protein